MLKLHITQFLREMHAGVYAQRVHEDQQSGISSESTSRHPAGASSQLNVKLYADYPSRMSLPKMRRDKHEFFTSENKSSASTPELQSLKTFCSELLQKGEKRCNLV